MWWDDGHGSKAYYGVDNTNSSSRFSLLGNGRRFHLAIVLEALHEFGAAARELTEALRIDPNMTDATRRLAVLCTRRVLPENVRLNPVGLKAALGHDAVTRDIVAEVALGYLSCQEPLAAPTGGLPRPEASVSKRPTNS